MQGSLSEKKMFIYIYSIVEVTIFRRSEACFVEMTFFVEVTNFRGLKGVAIVPK